MQLPDFEAWAIFASVVEHRSFSGAASAIGVSKATVSKAITRLEARLGTALFHRTSRRLTLTSSGKALADHAQRILGEGVAAEEAALEGAQAPAGLVRVAAPMSFGVRHVAPVVAEFLAAHPAIRIDLSLSDARVDIVAEAIDIALRIADLPDSSMRARRLSDIPVHTVAAPAYLARAGTPAHPAQLADHACFSYTNVRAATWQYRRADGESAAVRVDGPFAVDNGEAMLPALRSGLGIAMLPAFIVDRDLADGTLVPLFAGWSPPPVALHLVTPPSARRPARVEALIDFLSQRLRNVCQLAVEIRERADFRRHLPAPPPGRPQDILMGGREGERAGTALDKSQRLVD
ncbi:LysR family transcriptional regulator [Sphingomonas baiyangensis]|uniref:LysR family transcriptional regulator n=1 Tax=Sphingomonas baiyangensis TaxID=2572576 RepID=A0A4V5PUD5_9SPHN|nr:LysR family transcriptional regulator [Sphingomonas baiyangensis]TKD52998.1 LysR family transcriptional regulator [Sphingomonas baiyangensis]